MAMRPCAVGPGNSRKVFDLHDATEERIVFARREALRKLPEGPASASSSAPHKSAGRLLQATPKSAERAFPGSRNLEPEQLGELTALDLQVEAVRLANPEGDPAEGHDPAPEVARNVDARGGHLVLDEVVPGSSFEEPFGGYVEAELGVEGRVLIFNALPGLPEAVVEIEAQGPRNF